MYYLPITKYVYIACIHEIYCDQKSIKYDFYQNPKISGSVLFFLF